MYWVSGIFIKYKVQKGQEKMGAKEVLQKEDSQDDGGSDEGDGDFEELFDGLSATSEN